MGPALRTPQLNTTALRALGGQRQELSVGRRRAPGLLLLPSPPSSSPVYPEGTIKGIQRGPSEAQ